MDDCPTTGSGLPTCCRAGSAPGGARPIPRSGVAAQAPSWRGRRANSGGPLVGCGATGIESARAQCRMSRPTRPPSPAVGTARRIAVEADRSGAIGASVAQVAPLAVVRRGGGDERLLEDTGVEGAALANKLVILTAVTQARELSGDEESHDALKRVRDEAQATFDGLLEQTPELMSALVRVRAQESSTTPGPQEPAMGSSTASAPSTPRAHRPARGPWPAARARRPERRRARTAPRRPCAERAISRARRWSIAPTDRRRARIASTARAAGAPRHPRHRASDACRALPRGDGPWPAPIVVVMVSRQRGRAVRRPPPPRSCRSDSRRENPPSTPKA